MTLNWYATQSTHNKTTSDFLNSKTPDHIDWEITCLFYSALHLVNDYCDKHQIAPPSDHHERKEFVKNNLSSSYLSYKKLFDLSIKSRYTVGNRIDPSYLTIAQNNYVAFKNFLN